MSPLGSDVPPRLLVLGASGQVGDCLLARCRARGVPVLALSRTPAAATPGVTWLSGRLPDAMPTLPPLDAVLSAGPLDLFSRWLTTGPLPGHPRVVALSSMSAVTKAASAWPPERALAQRLQQAEQAVAAACERDGMPWTLLRPTLIYGLGRDQNISPLLRRARRWRLLPLPRAGGLRQPVHADDVAAAMLAAVPLAASHGRVLEIGGGERLSVRQLFERLRAAIPESVLPLPLPTAVTRCAARGASRFALAAKLARFEVDLVADNSEVERLLGIRPRPFVPSVPSD